MVGNIVAFPTPACLRFTWGTASQLLELIPRSLAGGPCLFQAFEIILPLGILMCGKVKRVVPAEQAAVVTVIKVQFERVVTGLSNILQADFLFTDL